MSLHFLRSLGFFVLLSLSALVQAETDSFSCQSGERGSFDFYVIAAFHWPGVCFANLSKPAPSKSQKRLCSADVSRRYRNSPLVLHGLWPSGFSDSHIFYCQVPSSICQRLANGRLVFHLPPLRLSAATMARLETVTPFYINRLHLHEWYKHGSCDVYTPDQFFNITFQAFDDLLRLFAPLRDLGGKKVKLERVMSLLSAQLDRHPSLKLIFNLHNISLRCQVVSGRERPVLVEVWAKIPRNFTTPVRPLPDLPTTDTFLPQACPTEFDIQA